MSDKNHEIAGAFAHPEVRAASAGAGPHPDRISLRDHVVMAEIGAFQQERGLQQRLRFNMVVELFPQGGVASDDVDGILSYDTLTGAIAIELAAERLNLLETLAERIAARILSEPQPRRIFLRIEKLDRGDFALGVEIVRARGDVAPAATASRPPPPQVVFLGGADVEVGPLIDAAKGALLLVPAVPALPRPEARTEAALRHITLLAIEQAAWAIASCDPRLNVVASRTEIDWAVGQGHALVWAPAKLVLDAPGAPDRVENGLPLAVWIAEQYGAAEVTVHGAVALPAESRIRLVQG